MGTSASKYGQYEANRGGLSPAVVRMGVGFGGLGRLMVQPLPPTRRRLDPNNPPTPPPNHTPPNHHQVELGAEASAVFFVIFLPLYMVAHWRDWLPKVYSSRRFLVPKQTLPHETPPHRRHLLSWLTDSWPVGDKDILRYYGLDALLFLRSLRLQSLATLLCALYGLCVILPVNLHGKATLNSPPWCVRASTSVLEGRGTVG